MRPPADLVPFFEAYARAFDSADGTRIARFYHAPCLSRRGDGTVLVFRNEAEIADFFGAVARGYRDEGNRRCTFSNVESEDLGRDCRHITMDWQLRDAAGDPIRGWRQTYQVVSDGTRSQILVSTFHRAAGVAD